MRRATSDRAGGLGRIPGSCSVRGSGLGWSSQGRWGLRWCCGPCEDHGDAAKRPTGVTGRPPSPSRSCESGSSQTQRCRRSSPAGCDDPARAATPTRRCEDAPTRRCDTHPALRGRPAGPARPRSWPRSGHSTPGSPCLIRGRPPRRSRRRPLSSPPEAPHRSPSRAPWALYPPRSCRGGAGPSERPLLGEPQCGTAAPPQARRPARHRDCPSWRVRCRGSCSPGSASTIPRGGGG